MLTLKDSRDNYYSYSGKTSDIVRYIALAGFPVIWALRSTSSTSIIPSEYKLFALLLVLTMLFDLFQYISGTICWGVFNRRKEEEVRHNEKELFVAPSGINWAANIFFWFKVAILIAAYASLVYVIGLGYLFSAREAKYDFTSAMVQERQVSLYYNTSTGELYPLLPSGFQPHTCVWTVWGDHGSQLKITTDRSFISNSSDPEIKSNGFLPPMVPIYVTCIDWENRTYQGKIGDY